MLWSAFFIVRLLERLVFKVYLDDQGVWVYSGIFPWNKGSYGINWRDISGASYRTGFLSWVLKSYTIRVEHRYTKSSELLLSNIRYGDQLVQNINQIVNEKGLY
ncbi:hypothetical protein A4G19_14750 [Pasteurellaceae bacterium Macca]|nr:hypothetical protein [Pasteurellaceae bacterium Macca]